MTSPTSRMTRGILKTFGRIVPKGAGGVFEKNVRALITGDAELAEVIMPLLQARGIARGKYAALGHRLIRSVQGNPTCRMLMTMPGVGPVTAMRSDSALRLWGLKGHTSVKSAPS
jgi:transposase